MKILWTEEKGGPNDVFSPSMDIYEREGMLYVELELPGVKRENIEAYISGDVISVEGTKAALHEGGKSGERKVSFLQIERKFGRFRRDIKLPAACDTRTVKARFKNGILVIELGKIEDRRGRKTRISID